MAKTTKSTAPSDYISTITLAAMLEMSPQTIINWRNKNRQHVPFIRVGSCVRYKRTDVMAYLENGAKPVDTSAGSGTIDRQ